MMQKMKKIISLILILAMALSFCGCDWLFGKKCEHEYEVTSQTAPTCTANGTKYKKCTLCDHTTTEPIAALGHDTVEETVSPTCTEKGYLKTTCTRCDYLNQSNQTAALGHAFGAWTTIKQATEIQEGLEQRICSICSTIESQYIASNTYADLSVIKEDFDSSVVYPVNSYEELLLKYKVALVNMSATLTCRIQYTYGNLNDLLNNLVADFDAPFNYTVSSSVFLKKLTFEFTYNASPTSTSQTVYYEQYASVNYNPSAPQRNSTFDDFKINDSLYTFNVSETEQLCYVLERGAKPVCASGSAAERVYEKLKDVLRDIVHDDMNDFEKVRAIHDYLVMSVTYDKAALLLMESGATDLQKYKCFYLDGVLFDSLAVCEGISKAFMAMCNVEGIPCVIVTGVQTANPQGVGHAWNKVYLNGDWYIVDVTSDGTVINEQFEILTYRYYLLDEETYSLTYTGSDYKYIVCDKKYNVYQNSAFEHDGVTYDFSITSQQELNAIVDYFESLDGTNLTVEFEIAFNVGESAIEEVRQAYQANGIYRAYQYIDHGNTFMLIK